MIIVSALLAAGTLALAASGPGSSSESGDGDRRLVDDFEGETTAADLPADWEPLHFEDIPRHTRYAVKSEDGNHYLHAGASRSASALVKRIPLKLKAYPILAWRWRVKHTVKGGNARTKEGDDYAGRVYVNFKYDASRVGLMTRIKYALAKKKMGEFPPLHTVNYIWANRLERGTFLRNAYSDRAMMVAVESGQTRTGGWVEERRNVYEDYKKAFGREPTPVTAVAVMTDTDNTGSSASADYDDIRFLPASAEGRQSGQAQ